MGAAVSTKNEAKSMWRIVFSQFLEHRLAVGGVLVILFFMAIALGADYISDWMAISPDDGDIFDRYGEWSSAHWFGTDEAGRDVFMRLVYGTRISLGVALMAAFSSAVIGVIVGSLAGYFGSWIDTLLMRITDALLALPLLPVLIILAAIDFSKLPGIVGEYFSASETMFPPSVVKMVLIMVVFSWMVQARLVRGAILSVKEREFVMAARTIGLSHFEVIFKEILPNVLSPVIVAVTLNVGQSILFESALSFLGLGIQPPTPSWGNMLNNGQEIIYEAPMLAVIPGLLILAVVMAFNFLGDGLQDAMDPKAIKR